MRDLVYLSETKMRALVPQLPGRVLRRLGLEAGVNAGVLSLRATLPAQPEPSLIAALDQVIDMIGAGRLPRWRTDPELRAGDWIQFDEEFRFGEPPPAPVSAASQAPGNLPARHLVYFVAVDHEVPFVLCGSRAHVLDMNQVPDAQHSYGVGFYTSAVLDFTRRVAVLPDEAALGEVPPLAGNMDSRGIVRQDADRVARDLRYGMRWLSGSRVTWAGRAVLSGHARVLAAGDFVLATPLYVEYSAHHAP